MSGSKNLDVFSASSASSLDLVSTTSKGSVVNMDSLACNFDFTKELEPIQLNKVFFDQYFALNDDLKTIEMSHPEVVFQTEEKNFDRTTV